MLSREDYIRHSLETNLFFLRIAKEHTILPAASVPPRDLLVTYESVELKNNFERLLARTVMLSPGNINPEVLLSGEVVTDHTLQAEKSTQFLTGIPIDTSITKMELALKPDTQPKPMPLLYEQVSMLNHEALIGINAAIAFKEKLLNNVLNCKVFSYTYPTMLRHVIEESRFYAMLLMRLQSRNEITSLREPIEEEILWNHLMQEHAKFIRGYLDPSEEPLLKQLTHLQRNLKIYLKKPLS